MDSLKISGKSYISSSRAAKEHGYHSDYIGQLIRSGKIKGQKVGRVWYVSEDSLAEYLGREGKGEDSLRSIQPIPEAVETPEAASIPEMPEAPESREEEKALEPETAFEEAPEKPEEEEMKAAPVPEMPVPEPEPPKVEKAPEHAAPSEEKNQPAPLVKKMPARDPQPEPLPAAQKGPLFEHRLMTYLDDEGPKALPLRSKGREQGMPAEESGEKEEHIPIHVMSVPHKGLVLDEGPWEDMEQPEPAPARRRSPYVILLLMLFGAAVFGAAFWLSLLIPGVVTSGF